MLTKATASDRPATLVTGAAGFIGFHCASALLDRGEIVVGIDNLSDYYSVGLKRARLDILSQHPNFRFVLADLSQSGELEAAVGPTLVNKVIHLAAQPGTRRSLTEPEAYVAANIFGHLNVLEFCRRRGDIEHLVYASSSGVYGKHAQVPFCESDRADRPASFYAATKRADELMSYAYSQLHGIPQTGLRFFTVYGPWGRPDMAVWAFTEAIFRGAPIQLFNNGNLRRDFTFIDDAVTAVLAVLDEPPTSAREPHRIYNVGHGRPIALRRLIVLLEDAIGREARVERHPEQPGNIVETVADNELIRTDFGFSPKTSIEAGVRHFVKWYGAHHRLEPHRTGRGVRTKARAPTPRATSIVEA